jgi:O-antigen/teichoic acid export membrane protein
VAVRLTGSVWWGTIALAVSWAAILVAYDLPTGARLLRSHGNDRLRPCWDAQRLIALGGVALPLGCVTMLISLNSNVPRYFIDRYLGEGPLGIFAAVASMMIAGNVVVNALAQSASPRLSKYAVSGDAAAYRGLTARLYLLSVLLGVGGVIVAMTAGREILTLFYGPEYARHSAVLTWLMASAALSYVFSIQGTSLTALRSFRIQAVLHALAAALSLPIFFYMTRTYGLLGAASALLIQSAMLIPAYAWANARARARAGIGPSVRFGGFRAA